MSNLIFTILFLSLTFIFFSFNPLMIGFWIIIQAMMTAIILSSIFLFSWFSYIIFMVYLGGILMLFSYIISMIPQFTIFPLYNKFNTIFFMTMMFFLISFLKEEKLMFLEMNLLKKILNLNLFFTFSSLFKISILLFIYLLYIMIMVVFLVENSKGSIRNK